MKINCGHQSRNGKNSKVTPVLIEHMNMWIVNNSQVKNLPIYDDTLLVPDPEGPWKKIRVSKFL